MINKKNILVLLGWLFLTACYTTKKPITKTNSYATIHFLHEHKGTANYEVIELSSHDKKPYSLFWKEGRDVSFGYDSINKVVVFIAAKGESDVLYKYFLQDGRIDSLQDYGRVFDNGTLIGEGGSSNWANDGIKKGYKTYVYGVIEDAFSFNPVNKPIPKDSVQFMRLNDSLYKKCSKFFYDYHYYYYYIAPSWHIVYPLYHSGYEIRFLLPEKKGTKRIIDINQNGLPPFVEERYIGTRSSISHAGGIAHNFSTGIWIIKIAMPGGDTITYKRTGDAIGNLTDFYVVPKSMGGNDSILFISQEYNNNYEPLSGTYFSHGGSYMIRPRKKSDKHIF